MNPTHTHIHTQYTYICHYLIELTFERFTIVRFSSSLWKTKLKFLFCKYTAHKMHFQQLQIDNIYWFDCDFCPSMMFKFNFLVLFLFYKVHLKGEKSFPFHTGTHFVSFPSLWSFNVFINKLIYIVSINTMLEHVSTITMDENIKVNLVYETVHLIMKTSIDGKYSFHTEWLTYEKTSKIVNNEKANKVRSKYHHHAIKRELSQWKNVTLEFPPDGKWNWM